MALFISCELPGGSGEIDVGNTLVHAGYDT
jgi:hypothetical protein